MKKKNYKLGSFGLFSSNVVDLFFQVRPDESNYLLHGKKLSHQYIVDNAAKVEAERLNFIKLNQASLRSETGNGLTDALDADDADPARIGRKVILSSSFVGGPRYQQERQQDAMAYVQKYGRPDLFLTMTTNPNWEEIKKELKPGQKPHDRPDLICRVFRMKKDRFLKRIKVKYGECAAFVMTQEYQKRDLPHVHVLLWLKGAHRIQPSRYDDVVCAEIPDPEADPLLHGLVMEHMMHGPCGAINRKSPCMSDGKCTKKYPRQFQQDTIVSEDGDPLYRRRSPGNGGFQGEKVVRINRRPVRHTFDNR